MGKTSNAIRADEYYETSKDNGEVKQYKSITADKNNIKSYNEVRLSYGKSIQSLLAVKVVSLFTENREHHGAVKSE